MTHMSPVLNTDSAAPAADADGSVAALPTVHAPSGHGSRAIQLLVFTSLYPNCEQPRHGVFVEERLRKLVATGRVQARVVAPVPWFPVKHPRFGAWAARARVPAREQRFGIDIEHPRYPVIPKVGMNVAAALMYRALLPVLRRLAQGEDFDVLDAHYFYPDGVAAVRLGKALGKPVVVTARGSDVTLLPRYAMPRRQILAAAARADAIITVSNALNRGLVALGVAPAKLTTLRNGVDLERFRPLARAPLRAGLGLRGGCVWLTVGHLIELKGVRLAIEALARTADATLLVAGDGPEADNLQQQARSAGVADRVRFLGAIAHDELVRYYNAADALIHPASREGMPNVVLEALACGTPVVAAPFDGVDEVIRDPAAGEVAHARSGDAIFAAWTRLQQRMPTREATRRFAESLGWEPVVDAQCDLYARVVAAAHASSTQATA